MHAQQLADKYEQLLTLFAKCHNKYNITRHMTEEEIKELGKYMYMNEQQYYKAETSGKVFNRLLLLQPSVYSVFAKTFCFSEMFTNVWRTFCFLKESRTRMFKTINSEKHTNLHASPGMPQFLLIYFLFENRQLHPKLPGVFPTPFPPWECDPKNAPPRGACSAMDLSLESRAWIPRRTRRWINTCQVQQHQARCQRNS